MAETRLPPPDKKTAVKRIQGSITEAFGKLTGDKATQGRGAAQKREAEADARAASRDKGKDALSRVMAGAACPT